MVNKVVESAVKAAYTTHLATGMAKEQTEKAVKKVKEKTQDVKDRVWEKAHKVSQSLKALPRKAQEITRTVQAIPTRVGAKIEEKAIEVAVGAVMAGAEVVLERAPQIATEAGERMGREVAKIDPQATGDKIYDTAAGFATGLINGMGVAPLRGVFNVATTCTLVALQVLYRTTATVATSVSGVWSWMTGR